MVRPNYKTVLTAALRWSLPCWAVLAFLAGRGTLPLGTALVGGGVAFALCGALAWRPAARLALLQQRLDRLQRKDNPTGPEIGHLADEYAPLRGGDPLSALAASVQRIEHSWGEERQALIARLQSAALLFDALPDPLVTIDRQARIVYANASARTLLAGGDNADLTGRDVSAVLRQPALLEAIARVIANAGQRTVELSLPERVEHIFEARLEPIADQTVGEDDARAVLILRDVTGLRRSERMRADFVANVSHELRTPLSTLIGFIETLQGPAQGDPAAQERFLRLMQTQAERMSRLVADLLSLSRIEMNEHTVPDNQVPLKPLIETVADLLTPQARDRQVSIELTLDANTGTIPGNDEELTQLFQNLIENAIKYCRAGTVVRVEGVLEGETFSVRITDSGEGIAREHLPRLTERFYRVDTARSRELGGTGLGLAIVKHIVNRHRGDLKIRSEAGVGSTFEVILPARADANVRGDPVDGT